MITHLAILALTLAGQSSPMTVIQQAPDLSVVKTEFQTNRLRITYMFTKDTSDYKNSKLWYKMFTISGLEVIFVPVPVADTGAADNSLAFDIPYDKVTQSQTLEYYLELINSNGSVGISLEHHRIDTSHEAAYQTAIKALSDANLGNGRLQRTISDLNAQVKSALAMKVAQLPTGITPDDSVKFVSDTEATLSFKTDKLARVKFTVRGGYFSFVPDPDPDFLIVHTLTLKTLPPDTEMTVTAVVLNPNDGSESQVTLKPAFMFKTLKTLNTPVLLNVKAIPADRNITVKFNTQSPGAITLVCREVSDTSTGQLGKSTSDGSPDLEDPIPAGDGQLECDNLKPSTAYVVELNMTAIDSRRAATPFTTQISTTTAPTVFDFVRPLAIEMSPMTLKVSWSASVAPSEASLEVKVSDAVSVVAAADRKGTGVSVALSLAQWSTVLSALNPPAGQTNGAAKVDAKPVIRAHMKQGSSQEIVREVQVTFTLPSKQEVASSSLSADAKKQLSDVLDSVKQGKKVDWHALLESGLSMLIKVI
jgi:hypothetical protein